MTDAVSVTMGAMRSAREPAVLQTAGVGSCLVIILYDPDAKVGGLAHAMLPRPSVGQDPSPRFVETAIDAMIPELIALGAERGRLVAKLIGGAHMFALYGDPEHAVGAKNIDAAQQKLQALGIPVTGEETGGTVGRNVRFTLRTGVCEVETKM